MSTAQKMKFSIKNFFSKCTKEMLDVKLQFLCSCHDLAVRNYGKIPFSIITLHCVKSVRIRIYSGPYFPAFWLKTEVSSVSLRIQSVCGKMWARITPTMDTFHAMLNIWRKKNMKPWYWELKSHSTWDAHVNAA